MDDIDQILGRLQEQAESARTTGIDVPEVTAEGSSEDGHVTATLATGKLTGLHIDPRAMRLTNAELSDKVIEAVNQAMTAHGDALTEALQDEETDFGQVNRSLDAIRQDANQMMGRYLTAMNDMLSQASGQRGNTGPGTTP